MKKIIKRIVSGILLASMLTALPACSSATGESESDQTTDNAKTTQPAIDPALEALNFPNGFRRGINLGNMLEAPHEGDWGLSVQDEYLTEIKNCGFDFVRIPISWSTNQTDGVIDASFF